MTTAMHLQEPHGLQSAKCLEAQVWSFKTITTIRPYFFNGDGGEARTYIDPLLGHTVADIDLGRLFWSRQLDRSFLNGILASGEPAPPDGIQRISRELDLQAVRDLPKATSVLRSFFQTMPSAADLIFCFRVITRCVAIVSRAAEGLDVHLARGIIATEYDQYRLRDILQRAAAPTNAAVGRCLEELLNGFDLDGSPKAVIIGLRNDGELHQAIILASLVKQRWRDARVVLDASGANEQFAFVEWVSLFERHRAELSKYIDYFLPRQDYKATLQVLINALVAGLRPTFADGANAVSLAGEEAQPSFVVKPPPIGKAFSHYIDTLPVFSAAGRRTIVGRLSPAKCHWAVCKFCTINSQHLMPRGRSSPDSTYQEHFDTLLRKIRKDGVESVILMDEALHPKVLVAFAKVLLSARSTDSLPRSVSIHRRTHS